MISRAHAAASRLARMPVVAVASRSHERAAERAAEFGARAVTYDELVAELRTRGAEDAIAADIVVVSTPPGCHAADAIRLLEAGAAVLLEKPLCRTLEEADRIVAAARAHGNRLLYGENLAYSPVVQHLLAHTGELGPLTHLEVRSLQGLPTWGDFTSDEWGGGALFDLGVHPLAVALLCANAGGAGVPRGVRARLEGGDGHRTDEHAEVFLDYGDALTARVEASWRNEGPGVWDAQLASESGVLRAEVMPTPSLERNGEPIRLPPPTADIPVIETGGYLGQLLALANDVAHDEVPLMNADFGRLVLDVVCAAYRSAGRDGAREALPFEGPRDRTPLELWRGG
jgi:predicted dehydrogenase